MSTPSIAELAQTIDHSLLHPTSFVTRHHIGCIFSENALASCEHG